MHAAFALAVLPTLAFGAYLLLLTLLSARNAPPPGSSRRLRFDVLVPAHDEAGVIGRTLASLRALDWPRRLFPFWGALWGFGRRCQDLLDRIRQVASH